MYDIFAGFIPMLNNNNNAISLGGIHKLQHITFFDLITLNTKNIYL